MHIQYLREFPEYCVKRVRRAAKISHIAVLTFDVGAELLIECLGVREVPLYGAYHWADSLEARQILQVMRLIPLLHSTQRHTQHRLEFYASKEESQQLQQSKWLLCPSSAPDSECITKVCKKYKW